MDTQELIARAEALLEGVTPGPWREERASSGAFDVFDPRDRDVVTVYGGGVEIEHRASNARFIAASRQNVPDLIAALRAEKEARERAEADLERDRTKVAETINAVHSEISGREWLLTGRGPYSWDDDRYRDEFAQALAAIRCPIDSLRGIARDWSNCPTDPEKIKAARTHADASAALARIRQEAADEALERAAIAADDDDPDIWDHSTGNRAKMGESELGRIIRALKGGA